MALDQHAANLVDTTVKAFNGDVATISPMDGISLIDSWTSALRESDQGTNPVTSGLNDLKAELRSGNPDTLKIQSILEDLTDQVKQAANSAETDVKTKLTPLAEALQGFSQQLGGTAGANTGRSASASQAPIASTVGGESTNSGAGASSLTDDDNTDNFSDRIGGTTSIVNGDNDSAMGMEDTTGAEGGMSSTTGSSSGMTEDVGDSESGSAYGASSGDGGRVQDGGSYGSGYGTGSNGDDYSANSGTQRSGVSGGSTSGGASDSETGSSGGRSQY